MLMIFAWFYHCEVRTQHFNLVLWWSYRPNWWNKHPRKFEQINIFILIFGCYVLNILQGTVLKVENKLLTHCWKNWGARKERPWDTDGRKLHLSNVTKCCFIEFWCQGVKWKLPVFYLKYITKFECFVVPFSTSYSRNVAMHFFNC